MLKDSCKKVKNVKTTKTPTSTRDRSRRLPLLQSALTATSDEIEIQICNDDIIEFDLSEKSSEATNEETISSGDVTHKCKSKARDFSPSCRKLE